MLKALAEFHCRDILRWGKNIILRKTRTKKRAGGAVYGSASSLETLVSFFKHFEIIIVGFLAFMTIIILLIKGLS